MYNNYFINFDLYKLDSIALNLNFSVFFAIHRYFPALPLSNISYTSRAKKYQSACERKATLASCFQNGNGVSGGASFRVYILIVTSRA